MGWKGGSSSGKQTLTPPCCRHQFASDRGNSRVDRKEHGKKKERKSEKKKKHINGGGRGVKSNKTWEKKKSNPQNGLLKRRLGNQNILSNKEGNKKK